jgi:TolB protein
MKRTWGAAALLFLGACIPPQAERAGASPSGSGAPGAPAIEDLRDAAIGSTAMEPPWRDLVRHTRIQSPGRATHPGPSRDGRLVAYASTEFGPHPQIAVRETYGAAPTRITQNRADNLFPRISPDGKLVAWASNREGNFDVYVARIDAPVTPSQVTFEEAHDIAPSWSPDGKKLVYCSGPTLEGPWQIVIVDVATRLKTFLGPGLYPDWSADAKDPWICFQSQPRSGGGRSAIWVVRPDGSALREVAADRSHSWSAINPRFSPCGRWIAYATVNRSPESRAFGAPEWADDIWIIRPDGTLDTRLTDDLSAEWWPAWGGDRVFFISNRGEGQNVWSVRVKPLEEEPK